MKFFFLIMILAIGLNCNSQVINSELGKHYYLTGYGLKVPFGEPPIKTDMIQNELMSSQEFRYIPINDINAAYGIAILNGKQFSEEADSIKELDYFRLLSKNTSETTMGGKILLDGELIFKNKKSYKQQYSAKLKETNEELITTSILFSHKSNIIRAYVITPIKNIENKKIELFFENIFFENEIINSNNEITDVYTVVPIMPQFGENKESLQEYIKKVALLPTSKTRTASTKNVFITVIIEKDGKVKFSKIMRGVSEKFDNEAKRIVESMPNWSSGQMNNGDKARVLISFPIWFE